MKVFCKVERSNTRRSQQESVGPGAIFADRDISLVHCKKVKNNKSSDTLQHSICAVVNNNGLSHMLQDLSK